MPDQPHTRPPFTPVDYLLAALSFPLLLFALMFVTSGAMRWFDSVARRRRIMLVLVLAELATVALVLALVL